VAADERDPVLRQDLKPAAHDLREYREVNALLREARDGEGGRGRAAHRPNVVDGVQGGDAPVVERVVNDGREEVDGLDEGEVVRETVNPRVVGGLDADDQVRVARDVQTAQDLGEFARRELGRSTGARDHLCETHRSTSETKDEGGRMKDEVKAICFYFIPHPSSFRLAFHRITNRAGATTQALQCGRH
jgi:hypothetical protein